MSAPQEIGITVDHPQSVPPANKKKSAAPLSDPPRCSPSPASSWILSTERDTKPPTQPMILPFYIDHIPDFHTQTFIIFVPETDLSPRNSFTIPSYVVYHTDRPIQPGALPTGVTPILIHRSVSQVTHLPPSRITPAELDQLLPPGRPAIS
ncbi:hypothetical protein J6590_068926, partial [Homalodisca vitripennis]